MSALDTMQGNLFSGLFGTVLTGECADVVSIRPETSSAPEKKRYTAFIRQTSSENSSAVAQMSKAEAQKAFVYTTDGRLWWRKRTGRRRPEAGSETFRKRLDPSPTWEIWAGRRGAQARYMRRYLVWNWHFGATDRVLMPANGDTLDDRIENIVVGDELVLNAPISPSAPRPDTGVVCPCCGAAAPVLSPNLIARAYQLPPQQEAILRRVWAGNGGPVTGEAIIAEMYADDSNGGPEHETARKYFKTQLCLLRKRIEGSGIRIETYGFQRGFRLVIEQRG